MGDFLLEMEWLVCVDGYHIDFSKNMQAEVLVVNSKYHRPYMPFQKYENLYSAFARLQTRDDLLRFANRFGNPGDTGTVEGCLRAARQFAELLVAKQTSSKRVWSTFRRQTALDWKRTTAKATDLAKLIEAEMPMGIGSIDLEPDRNEGVRLKIAPYSLLDGLWIQLARKLTQKTIIRTCRFCGSMFEAGPGAKKRSDATFCCREHSVRFHSLERSKGA